MAPNPLPSACTPPSLPPQSSHPGLQGPPNPKAAVLAAPSPPQNPLLIGSRLTLTVTCSLATSLGFPACSSSPLSESASYPLASSPLYSLRQFWPRSSTAPADDPRHFLQVLTLEPMCFSTWMSHGHLCHLSMPMADLPSHPMPAPAPPVRPPPITQTGTAESPRPLPSCAPH